LHFDPGLSSYEQILDWFFAHHNPTEPHKKQYQSAILYVDDAQRDLAKLALEQAKVSESKNVKSK
jgi:peptide methionine sulfoxide reductase MsrA